TRSSVPPQRIEGSHHRPYADPLMGQGRREAVPHGTRRGLSEVPGLAQCQRRRPGRPSVARRERGHRPRFVALLMVTTAPPPTSYQRHASRIQEAVDEVVERLHAAYGITKD